MNVVVWSPHPDDETLGMGATIAKHVLAGDRVTAICVTAQNGHRYSEFQKATEILGCWWSTLGDEGGPLLADTTLAAHVPTIVGVMDQVHTEIQPDVVYLPWPSAHPDHRAVYEAGVQSARVSMSRDHWWIRDLLVYGEVVHEMPLYPTGLEFNVWVDVTGEPIDRKMQAIEAYSSQVQEPPHPSTGEFLVAESVQAGGAANMVAAERFCALRISR